MSQKERHYFLDNASNDLLDIVPYREDDDEDDKYDDVPYSSSSSVGRSSIGSIPWADDAIRQNQLDWERVERMLNGEEALPDEAELRNEILEWQRKFPHLTGDISSSKALIPPTLQSFDSSPTIREDSLEIDCISNISLDSLEDDADDDKYDGFATPTNKIKNKETYKERLRFASEASDVPTPTNRHALGNVAYLLDKELHISSMPITTRKDAIRNSAQNFTQRRLSATTVSSSLPLTPTPPSRKRSPKRSIMAQTNSVPAVVASNSAKLTQTALHMPPILNAIDSRRRFRGPNRSFVQLTQIQQAKSAVATHQSERRAHASLAWHTAPRFFNNRNSIILPAINLQRIQEQTASTTSEGASHHSLINASSLGSGGIDGRRQYIFAPQRNVFGATATANTTPSTGGRSVSAAVHHPRMEQSSYYLPYSATKFTLFK